MPMQNKRSIPEILQLLTEQEAEKVKLAIADTDGVLRGKMISFDKFRSIVEKGFGFCDVVFGWDSADAAYDNARYTGWHTGYPDATAVVDIQSFRRLPWEKDTPFFLADFRDAQGHDLPVWESNGGPRGGFAGRIPLTTGMFGYSILRASQQSAYFHALFDQLRAFDIPLEGLHTETGPGVYEAAILYSDVLEAADRAILFKTAVKEIAYRHCVFASFMAKPSEQLPGCSGHVHQSLWGADGKQNLFYDAKTPSGISPLMEHYIAGQLFCLPHILPLFAPTVNSYKRLVEGAWAPTTITWGIDNRTTALRALPGGASSARLETRVVGSDTNPYLAMAGCLAAGLYGIRNKLKLSIPPTTGSGYADTKNGVLPKNLWEATQAMKASPLAKELFGETFTEHFTATREWEWRQFSKAVTDWEFKRYSEII